LNQVGRSIFLFLSHFLRSTGNHLIGKCSSRLLKKAVPARVIASASEAWREAIQTFFRFLPTLRIAAEFLSGLPRRYAPRNDSSSVFQQPASSRAFPAKTESPETLYLLVFRQFLTRNRFPLSLELLYVFSHVVTQNWCPPPPSRGHAFCATCSIFLFFRMLLRKTGVHFCATCSIFLFFRMLLRKTGVHFCATCSSMQRSGRCQFQGAVLRSTQ